MLDKTLPTIVQPESSPYWRRKFWEAHARYQVALTRCRRLEGIERDGQIRDLEHSLAMARSAESEAREEYVRLINIGTDSKDRSKSLSAACGD